HRPARAKRQARRSGNRAHRQYRAAAIVCRYRAGILAGQMTPTSAAAIAKLVRRRAGMFAEEPGEVRRIGKRQLLRDVLDRLGGEYQLAFGLGKQTLTDQMPGGDAGRALDVIVKPIDRHAEFLRIETELVLAAEIFV